MRPNTSNKPLWLSILMSLSLWQLGLPAPRATALRAILKKKPSERVRHLGWRVAGAAGFGTLNVFVQVSGSGEDGGIAV